MAGIAGVPALTVWLATAQVLRPVVVGLFEATHGDRHVQTEAVSFKKG